MALTVILLCLVFWCIWCPVFDLNELRLTSCSQSYSLVSSSVIQLSMQCMWVSLLGRLCAVYILASCLIYAWPLRPDRWLVGACFVDSWRPFRVLVWVHSFIEPDFLKTMYHSTIYHSNLSDQFALEIGLRLGLDSELHYFSIFHGE